MRIELSLIPPFACAAFFLFLKKINNCSKFHYQGGQSGVDKQAQKSGIKINDQFAQWLS